MDHVLSASTTTTPAMRRVIARATEVALSDQDLYPDGTAFVAADLEHFGAIVAQNAAEGRAVAIVFPDGRELLVVPRRGPWSTLRRRLHARRLRSMGPLVEPGKDTDVHVWLPGFDVTVHVEPSDPALA